MLDGSPLLAVATPVGCLSDRSTRGCATKPAIYAQFGIPYYWRIEAKPLRATSHKLGEGDIYHQLASGERLTATEPFPVDLPLSELLPRWARGN